MARRPRSDDATIWIGYADFLTTLAVLFFVLLVGVAAKSSPPKPGFLAGLVVDAATKRPLGKCSAQIGQKRHNTTDEKGQYYFSIDSLRSPQNVGLAVQCAGYGPYSDIVLVRPALTTRVPIALTREKVVRVDTLPGDALFEPSEFALRPEAIDTIVQLGLRLKAILASDEVVAVQGHTDDLPFPSGRGKDNWVLSGERAAAAARVLTDEAYGVGIPECQVTIMGFGPSRPAERIDAADSGEERRRKRAVNRRIEFRRLHGPDISGGGCVH